jgi:hypothetical protein
MIRKLISIPRGIYGATVTGVIVDKDEDVVITLTTTEGLKVKTVLKATYDRLRRLSCQEKE